MTMQDDWLSAYNEAGLRDATRLRTCGTVAFNSAQMERFPVFRRVLSDLEQQITARLAEPGLFAAPPVVTIPVVVHVVWNQDAQNITDAQIQSQIAVLNTDYGATNPDRASIPGVWAGFSNDSNIRFQLANRDPNGQPHSGINRVQTGSDSFSDNDAVKSSTTGGADGWDPTSYLNLWICNLGGGLLGYAQFPGGPPATDGVVIGYSCFGSEGSATYPYNLGRTATHEIGHWLNLHHIWGDTQDCSGSDFVTDTPTQRLPNYGAPTFPSVTCNNAPNGDMFMNYMDYVDDRAMFMFTSGQVARMRATLDTIRTGLATSAGIV